MLGSASKVGAPADVVTDAPLGPALSAGPLRGRMRAVSSSLHSLFGSPRELACLLLVLPQVWLWIALRAIDHVACVSNGVFYAAEGATLLVVLLLFRNAGPSARPVFACRALWAGALLMAVVPAALVFGTPLLGVPFAAAMAALAGVVLMGSYLAYFALCSQWGLRRAIAYLLLSFALVPVVRLPLDMLSIEAAVLFVAPLPFLYIAAGRVAWGMVSKEDDRAEIRSLAKREKLRYIIAELAVYGFAMGLFRVRAEGIHDNGAFVAVNFVIKMLLPLVLLAVVARFWKRLSIGSLCQAALVFLLVSMVLATNLGAVPEVAFVVFDYSRYLMVILLFLALMALQRRTNRHPFVVFSAGMAPYALSLTAGVLVGDALGSFGSYTSVFVLDVMCVLAVSTVLVSSLEGDADLRLFSDGDDPAPSGEKGDRLDARCVELAAAHALTNRETETMQLICRGRSKRYIAEHMGLSENTVRGYAKTLYAKLDVHSREELMELLGL